MELLPLSYGSTLPYPKRITIACMKEMEAKVDALSLSVAAKADAIPVSQATLEKLQRDQQGLFEQSEAIQKLLQRSDATSSSAAVTAPSLPELSPVPPGNPANPNQASFIRPDFTLVCTESRPRDRPAFSCALASLPSGAGRGPASRA